MIKIILRIPDLLIKSSKTTIKILTSSKTMSELELSKAKAKNSMPFKNQQLIKHH